MKKPRNKWEVTVTLSDRASAREIARSIGGKIRRVPIKKDIPGSPEFLDLIERVRKVDPKAARYMEVPRPGEAENRGTDSLMRWSVWSETAQGHEYWFNIHNRLVNSEP